MAMARCGKRFAATQQKRAARPGPPFVSQPIGGYLPTLESSLISSGTAVL
jgi:hypothetical protein